jgi:hypothetical protein
MYRIERIVLEPQPARAFRGADAGHGMKPGAGYYTLTTGQGDWRMMA